MDSKTVGFTQPVLRGELKVPGDKSISHRAVMFGSMAEGKTEITGFLAGEDCLRTIDCFRKLGVTIEQEGDRVTVDSPGMDSWTAPAGELYAGNSGTTARLMLGILAGSSVTSVLTGDESLTKRPMKRVIAPLAEMGASISAIDEAGYLPLSVEGSKLRGYRYMMPVASAQVKSAILLAGLRAEGETEVIETSISRDHTERMLQQFGAELTVDGQSVRIRGGQTLHAADVAVPGDISSAAFFMAAAAMVEGSRVKFNEVGLNPTRTGIIDCLRQMGAKVTVTEESTGRGEPLGTVVIESAKLQGIEISGEIIPRLIDELPVIALLATQAEGRTVIKDAEELRVKETDRIAAVTTELKKLGADIEATEDGMIINGPARLTGGALSSYGDHRLGMMAAIASLCADGDIQIEDSACIAISYPTFFEDLQKLVTQA